MPNRSEKKKRLSSTSIATITPVDLDSDSEEDEMADKQAKETDENEFKVKKTSMSTIAVDDLERLLDRRFAVLATAEQIDKMGERIQKNERDISDIRVELKQMNDKILCNNPPPHGAARQQMGPGRELSYFMSRRSLRIWPLKGDTDREIRSSFREFASEALKITSRDVESMSVERVRRTRTSPSANAYMEACITFKEPDDRDFVASRAVNLAALVKADGQPMAGVRLDIPGFLMPTFRDLNSYAFHARKTHGKRTKTHIKFDDSNASLILELRLPSSDNWLRVLPAKARELITEHTANELRQLQADMRERRNRLDGPSMSTSSWASSANSIPLGQRSTSSCSSSSSWQPPARETQPPMDFGGDR